jgi:hypothetical protein
MVRLFTQLLYNMYLTTITFRNDDIHAIRENKTELSRLVFVAQLGNITSKDEEYSPLINSMIIQSPRLHNDNTLYFHTRGTVVDIMNVEDPGDAKIFIKELEIQLKRLKGLKKSKKS